MITRPLDLAAKLRPPPRSFDVLFFVNVALIGFFFSLFGSRFVLAPGIAIEQMAGANAGARPTTHYITVVKAGQIFAGNGIQTPEQLAGWLRAEAQTAEEPGLLIRANAGVEMSVVLDIASLAEAAGFRVQLAAAEPESKK